MESPLKLESLDTAYVSLAALIRHLRDSEFRGRLHVALDGYEADVFLYGSESPSGWEKELSTGRESRGEEAYQRLLVRSREPGGLITIFEGTPDESAINDDLPNKITTGVESFAKQDSTQVEVSGEIIAAVERAVKSTGEDFVPLFRLARIEMGDDYPFIDPTVGGFEYADAKVALAANPSPAAFQQAVVTCLKRVVDQAARNTDESAFRERVAMELAIAARRQAASLGEFQLHLDRIAGTRVL